MEQLDWRSSKSLAKSLGTIVSIAGAFIATLYKGVAILKGPSPANLSQQPLFSQDFNWILGGLFLSADCVMASAFLIVQVKLTSNSRDFMIFTFNLHCMTPILCVKFIIIGYLSGFYS
jgi:hypothetical protein